MGDKNSDQSIMDKSMRSVFGKTENDARKLKFIVRNFMFQSATSLTRQLKKNSKIYSVKLDRFYRLSLYLIARVENRKVMDSASTRIKKLLSVQ